MIQEKETRFGDTNRAVIDCITKFKYCNNYSRLEPKLQSIIVKLSHLKKVKERASSKDLKHPEYFQLLEEPILMSLKNDLREIEQGEVV